MNKSDLELYGIVGQMFREIREEQGYTLKYVSGYLDVTHKTLQRYELGERDIKICIIKMLCEFYKIDCSDFMKEATIRFASRYVDEQKILLSDFDKKLVRKFHDADEGTQNSILKLLDMNEKGETRRKETLSEKAI